MNGSKGSFFAAAARKAWQTPTSGFAGRVSFDIGTGAGTGICSRIRGVPHEQAHRGAHPQDPQLFTQRAVETLRVACEECAWLLERGYSVDSVLDVVSRRHQLHSRQRLALQRSMSSTTACALRVGKELEPEQVRGRVLQIDGFNLIIGLEVALCGGILIRGADGAIRDLAGLRGSYHPIEETSRALQVLCDILGELSIELARVYLDRPVSNSGRLRMQILEHASRWPMPVDVQVVSNPDRSLSNRENVVSSDSVVFDEATSWFNLLRFAIDSRLRDAWLIDLRPVVSSPH